MINPLTSAIAQARGQVPARGNKPQGGDAGFAALLESTALPETLPSPIPEGGAPAIANRVPLSQSLPLASAVPAPARAPTDGRAETATYSPLAAQQPAILLTVEPAAVVPPPAYASAPSRLNRPTSPVSIPIPARVSPPVAATLLPAPAPQQDAAPLPVLTVAPSPTPTPEAAAQPRGPQVPAETGPSPLVAIATPAREDGDAASSSNRASSPVAGQARAELFSVPWHLQANAGLSYLHVGVDSPVPGQVSSYPVPTMTAPVPAPESIRSLAPAVVAALIEPVECERLQDSIRISSLVPSLAETAETREVRTAAAGHGHLAPWLLWPQRSMRWIGDAENGTTAWVRDYALDGANAQQLLDSLRCLAEQQGISLRRVMLNGHELWRSPSTP